MTQRLAIIIALSSLFGLLLLGAAVSVIVDIRKTRKLQRETGERQGSWWQRHKPTKRRLIQIYAALLFNANIKGFFTGNIYTGKTKYLCVPGLNCYSCPGATGACPLGALQNALASSGTAAPYYVLGIIILFGVLLGRTICGFLCPVGLGQELLYKIKTPKLEKSRVTRIFSYLKYVLLAVFVVAIPLIYGLMDSEVGGPVPAFCKYICPAGTFGGAIGLLINPGNADKFEMLGPLFTWKFCVLVAIVVACIFIFRCFCRFLCPLGALYGFFNKIALLGVKLDKNKCTDCGLCVSHCKMDVHRVGDHECINCGECMDVCPAKAISWKGSRLFLHKNAVEAPAPVAEQPLASVLTVGSAAELSAGPVSAAAAAPVSDSGETVSAAERPPKAKRGRAFWMQVAAWGLALVLLLAALVYYNFIDKDVAAGGGGGDATGNQVGDVAPDFTLDEYFSQDDFNLYSTRGKIVILNFWGTWCTPCVAEIPHFLQIAEDYSEQVTVVFIHSVDVEENVDIGKYVEDKGWSHEYARFAQDDETQKMYTSLGGKSTWPMTVILDETGKIAVKPQGSMDYDKLVIYIKLLLPEEE